MPKLDTAPGTWQRCKLQPWSYHVDHETDVESSDAPFVH
jgi:hypothetical protein